VNDRSEWGIAGLGVLLAVLVGLGGIGVGAGLVIGGAIDPLSNDTESAVAAAATANLLDCRGGLPVDMVYDGDSVLAVGIDASGSWVAVRRPGDLTSVGWLPASQLDPDGDLANLPGRPCHGLNDGAVIVPTDEPEDTPTSATTSTTTTSSTTLPPTDTTLPPTDTTAPPNTTTPPDTTIPPTDTTAPPPDTTLPPTDTTAPPQDTQPPIVSEVLVLPDVIFPGSCSPSDYDIYGSVYATVTGETSVSAMLSWKYLPTSLYEYSGTLPVSVEPGSGSIQLIGHVSDLPDPYPAYTSAPQATVEFRWIVGDGSGNASSAIATASVGRCS
jgi:hypothetical protein